MNTEYLKEFVVLAETKNFGKASDRLYMNQSTLSKHIKSLENELGINLFLRTTRRVELTNYGQTFLPYFASGLGNGMINMISAAIRQLVLLIPCLWFLIKLLVAHTAGMHSGLQRQLPAYTVTAYHINY